MFKINIKDMMSAFELNVILLLYKHTSEFYHKLFKMSEFFVCNKMFS